MEAVRGISRDLSGVHISDSAAGEPPVKPGRAAVTQQGRAGATGISNATTSTATSDGNGELHGFVFYDDEDEEAQAIQAKIARSSNDSRNLKSSKKVLSKEKEKSVKSPAESSSAAGATVADYQFFIQYTYTPECALLAYNFTTALVDLGVFEHFDSLPDHRVMAVQLLYLFYKYQMEHNDMALDLALALTYVEEAKKKGQLTRFDKADGFNFVMYTVFLAHVWNNDRTICLTDWYKEVGWQTFKKCCQLNFYVLTLLKTLRNYRLRAPTETMRAWVLRLCRAPELSSSSPQSPASGESVSTASR
uniref:Uncharacterized protein n=1 Tax=Chromera velia CCMP2878 TaxID=1169474 RepID=A0A0G4GDG0_9ALVE|mmetsp:Transcript_48807/g.96282  ORF Transcript_48807/g.96282 Transcript_48807/m.96282 type:complete len:305 (+) Transcript_48807:163-1077(+)|eukprot:Cvel_21391.t1-p1 / transcript=Cvel_21391.t1 / gene=Cvel_21391 / organism=Chromera_velia_CCMP2878 / gene_product=hypothetical protein / transcript_product=hypothetical protein / location=Cvel_scaffold2002:30546-32754(+) / protein_length=304 / sequence_SO=supercontig / SO=protein_coding / is_pseudo=false